jgi:hypothetical protein
VEELPHKHDTREEITMTPISAIRTVLLAVTMFVASLPTAGAQTLRDHVERATAKVAGTWDCTELNVAIELARNLGRPIAATPAEAVADADQMAAEAMLRAAPLPTTTATPVDGVGDRLAAAQAARQRSDDRTSLSVKDATHMYFVSPVDARASEDARRQHFVSSLGAYLAQKEAAVDR